MSKIRQYFSTYALIRGFLIALLGSGFIYLSYFNISIALIDTILGVSFFYFLLNSNSKTFFYVGGFLGLFWFWWIFLSFNHYGFPWAIPFGLIALFLGYGFLFFLLSKISDFLSKKLFLESILIKAIFIFLISYIHPLGFDWLKLEIIFTNSYLGIEKWEYFLILSIITISIYKKSLLLLLVFLYNPITNTTLENRDIKLVSTFVDVKEKWDKKNHKAFFKTLFKEIDIAINENRKIVVLPESVFPIFLNHNQYILNRLQKRAKKIVIVTGGLYWDGKTPHNTTYIFNKNEILVAHKVVLVPFGEANPLPDFLSKIVNDIFYDGALDYKASSKITDYKIGKKIYRNAICFEATNVKLYKGNPKNMIALSNNAWFTPSTEATLQQILLKYYSKRFKTTIYHSINMTNSYIVKNGKVLIPK